ncbi:Transcriptional regulator, contains XRE-family HTH domain [Lentzea fradiae]|uniref:Transcriptional regulator, contains XRE-family HTH domain n=1 Tax=Lentzea fradiae TaxID=200378 RepID=A0A1G7P086_9PSEU|nr:helix-turn-helix domain-containing protein [Lentzea fradiae]SDF79715.1 Transcriptional regulator, contains XRE-family HTH domain [Lentzea fradiae]
MASQLGSLLRQWRQRAGLSQEALAQRATVGIRTVRGLETGERTDPRMGTVRALADALELTGAERAELFAAAGRDEPPVAAPARFDPLHETVETLKVAIEARWRREEEQRQVHDPVPLPVRWDAAPEALRDSWLNIGGEAGLAGRLDQVVEVYRRVPSKRLVVLGRAGSGKTVLTTRFVLDLLAARDTADPVPVIFGLGSWHPGRVGLRDWLAEQLIREYPFLSAPGPGGTLASTLVDSQRVLPVLDGFDEIATGLHRSALLALNATTLPLLLTSRVDEYRDAVAGTDVLTSAAAVVLADLTADDLAGYLPRTTRRTGPGGSAWKPVLDEVRAGGPLAEVLTTPLMVSLARRVYSDTPDHDPAALLALGTPDEIERHLLSSFVPAVYGPARAARVRPWLTHLAEHLTRLGTHDIAWWQFGTSARVTGLAVGVAVGVADLVFDTLLAGQVMLQLWLFAVMIGLVTGGIFGLAHRFVVLRTPLQPVRTRLRLRGRAGRRVWSRALLGLAFGGAVGAAYGLVRRLAYWMVTPESAMTREVFVDAGAFALVFGLGAALVLGLVAALEAPLDVRAALSPEGLLRSNRRAVLLLVMMMVPVFAVFVVAATGVVTSGLAALRFAVVWEPPTALAIGLVGGIGGGLAYVLSLTAWGQWVVFARVWLPLTGRLPWRVTAFLDDAYRRGVLRRAGAVYQFRHARLQEHFARSR